MKILEKSKRIISLILALTMTMGIFTSGGLIASAAEDDSSSEIGLKSSDVDDSTESGKMLKEYLEYFENQGDTSGESTAIEEWGSDLEGADWYLEDTKEMEPIKFSMDGVEISDETRAYLKDNGIAIDEDGNGEILGGVIEGAIMHGLKGAMTGGADIIVDWAAEKLLAYIFGSETDAVEQGIHEIKQKLDVITKQLEQVLKALEKVLKEQEVKNYRDDTADATKVRDALQTVATLIRLNLSQAGRDSGLRKQFLEKFNSAIVPGSNRNVYLETAYYGEVLTSTHNHSMKNIFVATNALSVNAHFPWVSQQSAFNDSMNSYYLSTYIEMIGYCKLSLLWQMEKNKDNPVELANYKSLYWILIGGNKEQNIVSSVQKVIDAYESAPKTADSPNWDLLQYGNKRRICIASTTKFSGYMSQGGPYQITVKIAYPNVYLLACIMFGCTDSIAKLRPLPNYPDVNDISIGGPASKANYDHIKQVLGNDYLNHMRKYSRIKLPDDKSMDNFLLWDDMKLVVEPKSGNVVDLAMYSYTYNPSTGKQSADRTLIGAYRGLNSFYMTTDCYDFNTLHIGLDGIPQSDTDVNGTVCGQVTEVGEGYFKLKPDFTNSEENLVVGLDGTIKVQYFTDMVTINHSDKHSENIELGDNVSLEYSHLSQDTGINLTDGETVYTKTITIEDRIVTEATGVISDLSEKQIIVALEDGTSLTATLDDNTGYAIPEGFEFEVGDKITIKYVDKSLLGGDPEHLALLITFISAPIITVHENDGVITEITDDKLTITLSDDTSLSVRIDSNTIKTKSDEDEFEVGCTIKIKYIDEQTSDSNTKFYAKEIILLSPAELPQLT